MWYTIILSTQCTIYILGIGKHAINTWKECTLLKEKPFDILQSKVDSINPPPGIGRIPSKVGSEFTSFIADEWKHWTLLYSVYALHGYYLISTITVGVYLLMLVVYCVSL